MGILSTAEIDFDLELVEDFLSHYSIMCESMEPLIIGLAKANFYHENINELFRIFHNIKSASGFLKFEPILKLSMLCEDIIAEARTLKGPANDEVIDWLLLVNDQFALYRKDIETDSDYFSVLNPLVIKVPYKLEKD